MRILTYLSILICVFSSNAVEGKKAICSMDGKNGMKNVEGTITIEQKDENSNMKLTYKLEHLVPNNTKHGFHIHEYGKLGNKCVDAGGHYNPMKKTHGALNDTERHVGDLGNIIAQGGEAEGTIEGKMISLYGDYSVVGKAFVVHMGEDDLGKGNAPSSNTTGDAGGRLQCCIIAWSSAVSPSFSALLATLALICSFNII